MLTKYTTHSRRAKLANFVADNYETIQAAAAQFPAVPAWLFSAVAMLETQGGQSSIAQNSNNIFNIKATQSDVKQGCFYADKKGVKWAKYANHQAAFVAFGRLVTAYELGEITPYIFAQSKFISGYSKAQRRGYERDLQSIIDMYQLMQIFE